MSLGVERVEPSSALDFARARGMPGASPTVTCRSEALARDHAARAARRLKLVRIGITRTSYRQRHRALESTASDRSRRVSDGTRITPSRVRADAALADDRPRHPTPSPPLKETPDMIQQDQQRLARRGKRLHPHRAPRRHHHSRHPARHRGSLVPELPRPREQLGCQGQRPRGDPGDRGLQCGQQRHGRRAGYAGMTVSYLRDNYDSELVTTKLDFPNPPTSVTYCVQSTVGGKTWRKNGPGAAIVTASASRARL